MHKTYRAGRDRKQGPGPQPPRLASVGGGVSNGDVEGDQDRFLWQNDDWAVTPSGLQSKWVQLWLLPKDQLAHFRDLAAVHLPKNQPWQTIPFASALQAALAIHFPGEATIEEVAKARTTEDEHRRDRPGKERGRD
jgi:hypothetical protein